MKKYHSFFMKILKFLEIKFSIYLNRRVFVMYGSLVIRTQGEVS